MPPHRAPSDVRSFLVLAALGALGVALALGLSATGHAGAAVGAPGGAGLALLVAACVVALRLIRTSQYEMHRAQHAAGLAFAHETAMKAAQQQAQQAHDLLANALDALPIGIAIYDAQDREVIRNRCLGAMFPALFEPGKPGDTREATLRHELALELLAEPVADPERWVAQRMGRGESGTQPLLQHYADDRWVHTYEVRTASGHTVVARAEVTDLVRKEQMLAQANENLSRQSTTDGLTGVANRRKFDEMLSIEWQRAARSGGSLSLLLVDIDHFKRFNDHYGHVAGDECLRKVAHLLAGCVRRAGELLARYGGEEFVLLLPGADMEHARDLAERCLQAIHRAHIPHGSSPTCDHVTFSIGVAQVYPAGARDPEGLVNAADTAMYRAKMDGRARFEVAGQADWDIDKDAPRSHAGQLG
ncbi:MAG: diguanylate cyclase [Rhodoferax sp.]